MEWGGDGLPYLHEGPRLNGDQDVFLIRTNIFQLWFR
jgi:hypothetical protein